MRFLKSPLTLIVGLYIILGIYLVQFFQYQVDTDGTAILSIAYAFKNLDLTGAINAHWGIFPAVIITPFLFFTENPILAIKFSQFLIGILAVINFYLLAGRININPKFRNIISLVFIFIVLYFGYSTNTGDLLIVAALLGYLNILLKTNFLKDIRNFIPLRIYSVVLILTKEYFLYFLILHFLIFLLFNFSNATKKQLLKYFLIFTLILFSITIIWGLVLSYKYKYFMVGSRGSVSLKIFNPRTPEYPIFTEGLIEPINKYGISSWDEPVYLNFKSWSPLESTESFIYYINLVKKNFLALSDVYKSYSVIFLPVYILVLLYNFFLLINKKAGRQSLLLLVTTLVFPLGYVALAVEGRYIWINYVLVLLLFFKILGSHSFFAKGITGLLIACLLLIIYARAPIAYLKNYRYQDHRFYDNAKFLKANFNIQNKKIATNKFWHESLYTSIYYQNKFYGQVKPGSGYSEVLRELRVQDIDYFFIWEDESYLKNFQNDFKEIKQTEIQNLHLIYLK